MLNTRYLDYVPAMSRGGGVACLSGRTAAYRRSAILPVMPSLEREMFLGRQCVAGDDGRLTWLVLAAGYRTVHQASAQADSMFPDSWQAFAQQRIRWSRNSYRCYLTAMAQGWLWRQPLVTQITVLQVLLTPVTMGAAVFYLVQGSLVGWQILVFGVAWAVVGRAIRGTFAFAGESRDIVLVPLMALVVAMIALPIKLWAAGDDEPTRLADQGRRRPSARTARNPLAAEPVERSCLIRRDCRPRIGRLGGPRETGADDVRTRRGSAGAPAAGGPGDHRRADSRPGRPMVPRPGWAGAGCWLPRRSCCCCRAHWPLLALRYRAPEPPPAQTATSFEVLPQVPDAVLRAQMDRSRTVFRMIGKLTGPDVARPGDNRYCRSGRAAHPRPHPAGRALLAPELRQLVPAAFAEIADGADRRRAAAHGKPAGAVGCAAGHRRADPGRPVDQRTVGFRHDHLPRHGQHRGRCDQPVRISSWDPERGAADENSADGRSFIVQTGGRMDANHAVFSYLGFNVGVSSGVAWSGASAGASQTPPVNAEGDVSSSMFLHNYFGAYTRRAEGMQWVGNTFADNEQYGFDPHDFSNNFLVEGNVAYGNGKHGFIFSRGCAHNILRGNIAHDNGGHGFMIDDGRSRPSTAALPDQWLERQRADAQHLLQQRRQRDRDRGWHTECHRQ